MFNGVRAFDVFRADIEQADARTALFGIEGVDEFAADHGKLHELLGRAINVCAQIEHQRHVAVFGRYEFGYRRTLDALYGFQHETGGGHQRAGVARRYGSLRQAVFDLVDGNAH